MWGEVVTDKLYELDEMGPVDFLVIEFPEFIMTGEGLAYLVDLVDRGVIRVLDLVFVSKDASGKITVLAAADVDHDGQLDFGVFEGASSGLLADDDIRAAADALAPGSAGGVLVYENTWAAPMARALRRNGAQLVASGRIPVQAVLAAAEALDTVSA
jgi:uncharacterized protein DUF6325